METSILAFWTVIAVLLIALRRWPDTAIARAAFTWFGPIPLKGESWAKFQFRWAAYSFSWWCQFCFALTVLWFLSRYIPRIESSAWFQIFFFALPLGAGMALLALINFLVKATKAHLVGPNPIWGGAEEETHVV